MTYSNDLIYFKHLKDSRTKLSKQESTKKGKSISPLSVMISHFQQIDTLKDDPVSSIQLDTVYVLQFFSSLQPNCNTALKVTITVCVCGCEVLDI